MLKVRVYALYGYTKIGHGNFKDLTTCRDKGKFLLIHTGARTCVRVGMCVYIYMFIYIYIYIHVMEVKGKVCCLFYAF
jgi:hypothetical protein